METLYVYDHCPFCVRARMIFGLKKRPFELVYLLSDDEETPISMVGKKMLPILKMGDNCMGESLDIVEKINNIDGDSILTGQMNPAIKQWIDEVDYLNKLLMPRFTLNSLPEFATNEAIQYFTKKKEAVFGSFEQLLLDSDELLTKLNQDLQRLDSLLATSFTSLGCNGELSMNDILLFPWLRNLTIVENLVFPSTVERYVHQMAEACNIPLYHSDK